MSDPGVVAVVAIVFGSIGASIRWIANAISRASVAKRQSSVDLGGGAADARLARLEQAVDAIAVEIERISEGQRFTTRLLADRAQREAQHELQRAETPPGSEL